MEEKNLRWNSPQLTRLIFHKREWFLPLDSQNQIWNDPSLINLCLSLQDKTKFAYLFNLSHDQEYLYDICWGIIEGNLDEDFTLQQPGPLCHDGLLFQIVLRGYTLKPKNPVRSLYV